jgi:peptidyl-dipeptidase Dcp
MTTSTTTTPAPADNAVSILLAGWTGPYGGLPPFDRVEVSAFKPALEAAMAENLAEVERIAHSSEAPDFENTIAAMERAGSTLRRVNSIYGVWSGNMSTPEFQGVQREMAPRLAAFNDRITQNEALFRRIKAVYDSPAKANLTPEQQRLVWLYYTNFVRAGAQLDATAKARLSAVNQELQGCSRASGRTSSPMRPITTSSSTAKLISPDSRSRFAMPPRAPRKPRD